MVETTIIFLRHGAVKNDKRIIYGRLPGFPLSELGIEQVKKSAQSLSRYPISRIYTSPLLRTGQTAKILSKKLHLQPKISELLIEVKLIFQGMPIDEYKKKIQAHLYDQKYLKKGQESIGQIERRMLRFVKMIEKRHKNKTVLVVSHGDPIVILKAVTTGQKFTWEYKRDNYLITAGWMILKVVKDKFNWQNTS
ncbi:hypothetical protein A2W14_01645 [Candidatus Gottesmanbacteria bacterium RBG_16_37_8]|uniref:Phosphoglycerate mutase n=1 Tax=Candidatus Gottesmanbacteria bacterium RBG_16_37_8 TaxID=1798371 RepID=A0A1F5YQU6_9BACT|nr:MAG: hypothetical protein A2W14_01645 [Candidatus Gottesmanbacteria bacterium RBG_16_37_8]